MCCSPGLVERVANVLPQEHFTVTSSYLGWMSLFMGGTPAKRERFRLPSTTPLHSRLLGDLRQELVVGPERLQTVDEQLQTRRGVAVGGQSGEHASQLPHHLQLLTVVEQLLVAGAGRVDVDG